MSYFDFAIHGVFAALREMPFSNAIGSSKTQGRKEKPAAS
jgi:hypothetical protein